MGWTPNREELAWAAGFFDGEGSTFADPRPRLGVSQNDLFVLERFRDAIGMGTISVHDKVYGRAKKPVHQLRVNGWRAVQAAIAMLWPWLSPIKKAQATKVLRADHARVNGRDPRYGPHFRHCGQPHIEGVDQCRECSRTYWRDYRRRVAQKDGQ